MRDFCRPVKPSSIKPSVRSANGRTRLNAATNRRSTTGDARVTDGRADASVDTAAYRRATTSDAGVTDCRADASMDTAA